MAKAAGPEKVSFRQRLRQIGMVFSFTAKRDKWFLPLVITAFLLPLVGGTLLATFTGGWIWLISGLMAALVAAMAVLSVRSNKAMMIEAERQPGAAASIIENMRGDWRVTPGLASTTQMDFVHLVIGRPGVILVAEGNPSRVRSLLGQEKRRLAKVIGSSLFSSTSRCRELLRIKSAPALCPMSIHSCRCGSLHDGTVTRSASLLQ